MIQGFQLFSEKFKITKLEVNKAPEVKRFEKCDKYLQLVFFRWVIDSFFLVTMVIFYFRYFSTSPNVCVCMSVCVY